MSTYSHLRQFNFHPIPTAINPKGPTPPLDALGAQPARSSLETSLPALYIDCRYPQASAHLLNPRPLRQITVKVDPNSGSSRRTCNSRDGSDIPRNQGSVKF